MEEKPFKTFTCSYEYQGDNWCVHLMAPNMEDAKARLIALKNNGTVDYELLDSIPWNPEEEN